MNAYAPFPTAEERAALGKIARREPQWRAKQRRPGVCTKTVFENGAPVAAAPQGAPAARAAGATLKNPTGTPAAVTVSWGTQLRCYDSVRKAFADLGLPDSKHVKFRAEMKRAGAKVFSFNGTDYAFKVAA